MTGWPVAWKCFVACLFLEESQQPTWPHVRQRRRCTHGSPVARHSSQPSELGVTGRICLTCGQVDWAIAVLLLADVASREIAPRIGESVNSLRELGMQLAERVDHFLSGAALGPAHISFRY